MKLVLGKFPAQGVVALFYEPSSDGDPMDFDAPRNAPAKSPEDYLPLILFHSSLDNMETVFAGDVVVSHPFIDMAGTGGFGDGFVVESGTTEDHILYEHNLGYPPIVYVAVDGNIIWPGMLIHADGPENFWREGTVHVDDQYVRLFVNSAALAGQDAPAADVTYTLLVIKQSEASGNIAFEFDPDTGVTAMGMGKFNSGAGYVQVVDGGSPFGFNNGRTIDAKNGCDRAYRADGTYSEVGGGSSARFTITPGDGSLGAAVEYDGTYAGPPSVLVQAP